MAKQFEDKQIVVRLEELAKTYEKKIFEPAKTLKEGKLEELVKKGKVESKGEKRCDFKTIKIEKLENGITKLVLNRR